MRRGLGVGTEQQFGVPVEASKWYNVIMERTSTRRSIIYDEGTVADRQIGKMVRGAERVEVTVEQSLNAAEIGHFLKSCFGSEEVSGDGPYVHTFRPSNTLPSLTLRSILDGIKERVVAGSIVNSMEIVSEPGRVTVTTNLIGKSEMLSNPSIPSFSNVEDFDHGCVTVKVNNVHRYPRRLTLRINNNLETIEVLGEYYPIKISPRKLSVTGSLEMLFEDDADYQDFLSMASKSMSIKFAKDRYSLELQIGRLVYSRAEVEVRGREMLMASLDFTALKPQSGDSIVAILVNDDGSTY